MSNFPTNLGSSLKYKQWNVGLYMQNTGPLGLGLALGNIDDGGEFHVVQFIVLPRQPQEWNDAILLAGGMGAYFVSLIPAINAALARYFDPTPTLPLITNQSQFSEENFNIFLKEWIGMEEALNNDCPKIKILSPT